MLLRTCDPRPIRIVIIGGKAKQLHVVVAKLRITDDQNDDHHYHEEAQEAED